MKLFGSRTSPYVRKCRIVVIEKNLAPMLEEVMVVTAENPKELLEANPLGKIPALVLEDERVIVDSPVICEYLDSISAGPRLIPQDDSRFEVMHMVAIADGVIDASVALTMENKRPEQYRYPAFIDRQKAAISRTLDVLEKTFASQKSSSSGFDMADIAMVSALGYIDFRHPNIEWRTGRPQLAKWFETANLRPSVKKTEHTS